MIIVIDHEFKSNGIFPLGEKVEKYFQGEVYINKLFTEDKPLGAPIWNVTFSIGACTNWHIHKVGQVLLVLEGTGWYQEEGKEMQVIKKGDVINIPAGVKHWHGANRESSLTHLAITPGETEWLEEVER